MVHTVLELVPGVGPLQESTQGHSGDTRSPFGSFHPSLSLYRIILELFNKRTIVFRLIPRGYSTPGEFKKIIIPVIIMVRYLFVSFLHL